MIPVEPDDLIEVCDLEPRARKAKGRVEQADGDSGTYHSFLKRRKVRVERRRAKLDPETVPAYGKYSGYET
jgi:hypothetical protein